MVTGSVSKGSVAKGSVTKGKVTVRAAGGVVWRISEGELEVALVHRPRYDDWSLPKGKLDPGETELAAAVREVEEELGSRVAVSRRLTRIGYDVEGGRKTVAFWVMRHVGGEFVPDDEVDQVQWLPPVKARDQLDYDVERDVLDEFTAVPLPEAVVVLVRHAKAGKRTEWRGDDALRPLDHNGVGQAEQLTGFLAHFAPDRVISASPLRCVQTVTPCAEALGVEVIVDPAFSDDDWAAAPLATETALLSLGRHGSVSVVCSQGGAIPGLVDSLLHGVRPTETKKGAAWVLSFVDGTVLSADYYADAPR